MPKVFSEEEKLAHKTTLLEQGLSMIMERGYKNVTVDQLIGLIHASKGILFDVRVKRGLLFAGNHVANGTTSRGTFPST